MKAYTIRFIIVFAAIACIFVTVAHPQTSVFLYEGRLNDGGNPATGTYDMEFKLYDALAAGNQIGPTQTNASPVLNLFSVTGFDPTDLSGQTVSVISQSDQDFFLIVY